MVKMTEIANELSKRKPYLRDISTSSSKAEVYKWFDNLSHVEQLAIHDSPKTRLEGESANDFLLRSFVKRMVDSVMVSQGDLDVTDMDLISDEELDEMFADELNEDGSWKEPVIEDED